MSYTVCQILPALDEGGVERGTIEVARALTADGHRAIVVSAGGRLVGELEQTGALHVTLPIGRKDPRALRAVPALRHLWQRENVDIVHVRSRFPGWLAALAWRSLPAARRPRRVTTVHGAYAVNGYSRIMLQADRIIAISDFIRGYIVANYHDVDPARIEVIPRGVSRTDWPHGYRPDAAWRTRWQQEFPGLDGKRIVTLAARLTRRKGHADFCAIVTALRARYPVHGLIVGAGHATRTGYLRELRALIAAQGLAADITLTGHRSDLREIFAMSAISFALAEAPEAFGRTTLEALSLGIPVIGYDLGGTGEILRRVYPAGLVAAGDTAAAGTRAAAFLEQAPPVPPEHPFLLAPMLAATLRVYAAVLAEVRA